MRKIVLLNAVLWILSINAFTQTNVYPANGNTGLGIVNPEAKLHIVGGKLYIGIPGNIDSYDLLYSAGANPGFRQEVQRSSGGAAFDLFNVYAHKTSAVGKALWGKIGMYGGFGTPGIDEVPNVNYMFFGTNPNITYSNNTFRLYPNKVAYFDGNVGIGIANPSAKLDINGGLFSSGAIAIGTKDAIKIGTHMLAVNGSALFTKATVKLNSVWPDYVFDKDYKLPTLNEIEYFVKLNGHLSGVPTAKEVEDNGINLGDNQVILLKKIEELTLIIIELNKRIEKIEQGVK